jgi:hypothetical protein
MSDPQISRRCPGCGAAIREQAFFCPQCGKELPKRQADQSTSPLVAPELSSGKPTAPLADSENNTTPASSDTVPLKPAKPVKTNQSASDPMSDTIAIERPAKSLSDTMAIDRPKATRKAPVNRPRGAVGAKIQRATNIAREVEGDVIHRVQKVREISHVVIDEAGYDPSLRFVLVAAGLFLLFLLIVLLNKVIA